MKVSLILTCAGKGLRAGFNKNKLLVPFNGFTVLERTVKKFVDSNLIDEFIITANSDDESTIKQMFSDYTVVLGGKTRTESIKNALNYVSGDITVIHDGARPFVSEKEIKDSIISAEKFGSGICAVLSRDTVADSNKGVNYLGKDGLYIIKTPQTFKTEEIKKAYSKIKEETFNDDGEIYGKFIKTPKLVLGSYENIKLTYPEDFNIFNKYGDLRLGTGFDCHKLVENRKLILGGVEIPHNKGLLGHSDADVLTHAIMDAILSSLSLRDIGYYFPDTDDKYKDANSIELLKEVLIKVKDSGYKIENVSAVIQAEKPKLLNYIPKIKENLANVLGISLDKIGIGATTLEGLGFVGREEGICVNATAVVKKIEVDFSSLTEFLKENVNSLHVGGCACTVYLDGKKLYEHYEGYQDIENNIKLSDKSVFRLCSMTKPVTAVAIMICEERGLLSVDDEISKYLPEYKDIKLGKIVNGKVVDDIVTPTPITIKHCLTHTSGLGSGEIFNLEKEFYPHGNETLKENVEKCAKTHLSFIPYKKEEYSSYLAPDILARIVEIVTNENYYDFIKENIFDKLDMKATYNAYDVKENLVISYSAENGKLIKDANPYHGMADFPCGYTGGGAGLMSTMNDYAKFANMLANYGEYNGVRVLSKESVKKIGTPKLPIGFDSIINDYYNWGYLVKTSNKINWGQTLPVNSFGWGGAYGTHFFVSPNEKLTCVYMHNSLTYGGAGTQDTLNVEYLVTNALRIAKLIK